jgi:ELWxxDGT repeat protein
MHRLFIYLFIFLLLRLSNSFGQPILLKNCIPGINKKTITYCTSLNNKLLLVTQGDYNNYEIWITDGSSNNTIKLDSFNYPGNFNVINGNFYYTCSLSGYNFFKKSDGTKAGTITLLPFGYYTLTSIKAINDKIYFAINSVLYVTDGTANGTKVVKGDFPYTQPTIHSLVELKDTLFFIATTYDYKHAAYYSRLWKCNGSYSGTEVVIETDSLSFIKASFDVFHYYNEIYSQSAILNDVIYFAAAGAGHGLELWRSDGTAGGTYLLKAINPNIKLNYLNFINYSGSSPRNFITVGNSVYFTTIDTLYNVQLWKTDGTESGTQLIKDFCKSNVQCNYPNPSLTDFVEVNGKLFFKANFEKYGSELWVTDGTDVGTKIVDDIWPGPSGSCNSDDMVISAGNLYYSANDGKHGLELWRTNSNDNTTELVADMVAGAEWSYAKPLLDINGLLYFSAKDTKDSIQLWKVNGNTAPQPIVQYNSSIEGIKNIGNLQWANKTIEFYNNGLSIDTKDNVYISGTFQGNGLVLFEDDFIKSWSDYYDDSSKSFLIKYDSDLSLQWVKLITYFPFYYSFSPNTSIVSDTDDNLFFACAADTKIRFDTVTHKLPGPGLFLNKLSSDGKQLWYKILLKPYNSGFSKLTIDKQNNIYLLGKEDASHWYIYKFDNDGNFLWEKVLDHDLWSGFLDVAIGGDKVYVITSQLDSKSYCSTFNFSFSSFKVYCLKDAEILWTKEFDCSNSVEAVDVEFTTLGELQIIGNFVGTLSSDKFSISTDCSMPTTFTMRLTESGDVLSATLGTDISIPSQLRCNPDGSYYEVGMRYKKPADVYYPNSVFPSGKTRLYVQQKDYLGNTIQQREFFRQDNSNYYFNPKFQIDSKNNIFIYDLNSAAVDTIPSVVSMPNQGLILMKINGDLPKKFQAPNEEILSISPNPASERIYIKSADPNLKNYSLKVVDNLGRMVATYFKSDPLEYFEIDISKYHQGIYFVVVEGNGKRIIGRLIKE